ncbi:hypothetical protein FEM48_Zijuj09G0097900 [Ziziphus jujuba var. spinosa]|uniref:CRM domain-containing protein n=1 Tax=Ziziphus jujuba var. spinosa TaxID=714518 RepID=A0A978USA5_ZIZJJ|nr:hypothetical protein FEM48_Zijuj09G0097900 [Ziziphus jujuba var. spinosa]
MAAATPSSHLLIQHLLHRPPSKPSASPPTPSSFFSYFLKPQLVISDSNSINPSCQSPLCSFPTTGSNSTAPIFSSLPRFPCRSHLSSNSLTLPLSPSLINASHQSYSVSLEKEAQELELENKDHEEDEEEKEEEEDELEIEVKSENLDSVEDSHMSLDSLRPNGNGVKLPNLTVKEKKELASYAHSLGKKLKCQLVGKSGVTANVATSFIETLEANELLKIKIHRTCPGELDDVVKQLEESTGSVVVGQIGRVVILYRPSLSKLQAEEKRRQARKIFVRRKLNYKSLMPVRKQRRQKQKKQDRDCLAVEEGEAAGFK